MMALIVLIWLGFQVLAISMLYGMMDLGFTAGSAMAIAVVIVTAGAMITRSMYRKTYIVETTVREPSMKVMRSPQTSLA